MNEPLVDSAGIFNRALGIYREHAAVLFPAALIVGLIQAISIFALADAALLAFLALVVTLAASGFFQAMAVEVARDAQDGRPDRSVGELFRIAAPVVIPLLLVSMLAVIGIVLGLLLLIVPGLMLLTIWAVVVPVVVIERPSGLEAFRRSNELVRGHGWPVFGLIVMVAALTFLFVFASALFTTGLGDIGGSFVQLLLSAVIAPIMPLVTTVLYFRLVEIHAEQTFAGPPAVPAPDDQAGPPPAV